MSDLECDGEAETVDIHLTIKKSHAERAMDQYDVHKLTDAIRMASLEGIRERESQLYPRQLHDSYLSALEEWTEDRDAVIIVNDGEIGSLVDDADDAE